LLLDYWPLHRAHSTRDPSVSPEEPQANAVTHGRRLLALEKIPLLVVALGSCIITLQAQRSGGAISNLETFPLALRVENATIAYIVYLSKAILPINLAPFYLHFYGGLQTFAAAALCLIVISVGCILRSARQPYCLVGWLWFLGTLVPVIGIVQVGVQSSADRY